MRDHLGRAVALRHPARRVVSLCPSLTETLLALAGGGSVIGRTEYCTRPVGAVDRIRIVGGPKTVDVEAVAGLNPDVVIASKEENQKAQVELLAERFPVFVVDVSHWRQAMATIIDLGEIVGHTEEARRLAEGIERGLGGLRPLVPAVAAAYLVWREPFRAAGGDTFIDSLLDRCGLRNVFRALPGRYPEVGLTELAALSPAVVLLGSEPYPFDERHIEEIRSILPEARVIPADGEAFSWYGARMVESSRYLAGLISRIARDQAESGGIGSGRSGN